MIDHVVQLVPSEPDSTLLIKEFALALIWSLTAVHVAGVGSGRFLQQFLTVLKVGAILLLMVGAFTVGLGDWQHLVMTSTKPDVGPGALVGSFIFVTYAYSGMVITAFTALTVRAVTILRQRGPQLVCSYHVPFYPVLPLCYILVAGVIMTFLSADKPVETFRACLTLSAGIPLYFLMRRHIGALVAT